MVQLGHAWLLAGRRFSPPSNARLVLLQLADEAELLSAVLNVQRRGIRVALFYEPEFPCGHTAACTQVVRGRERKAFRQFALWKS